MKKLAIIGMGTMGSAIHERMGNNFNTVGVSRSRGNMDEVASADIALIAIKPQSFGELATELRPRIDQQLVISIMAGVSLRTLVASLGTEQVVRTMPNLALKTGQSLTAWHTHESITDSRDIETILGTWGTTMRLYDEEQFHAFTALAGSGPAYYYELARMLEQAAQDKGFSAEQARLIAMQTFIGAASVVACTDSPAKLVQSIASKGGTTEAALNVFHIRKLDEIYRIAIDAACTRSQELGH